MLPPFNIEIASYLNGRCGCCDVLQAANVSAAEDRFEYQLQDQRIRDSGIAHLKLVAHMGKPFFVGVGFHK